MRLLDLRLLCGLLIAGALGCSAPVGVEDDALASSGSALTESSLQLEVTLRGTSPVQIHAHVWDGGARGGATVLAVHGLSETGATYGPLANAIFQDRGLRRRIRRVIAIDQPGHGESGVPDAATGLRFGDLAIEDYVGVVIDSIRALRSQRMAPSVLIGHSMGGLEVQVVQDTLLAQGTSLARLGVRRAILLAPVPPHGQPWTVPMSGDLSPFVMTTPELGTFLQVPPLVFIAQSFGTPAGTLVANAPTEQEVTDAGYVGAEPLSLVLQLVEAPVQLPDGTTFMPARPSVRERAFAARNGTLLELASFSLDPLVPAADLAQLYPYLTGDARNRLYTPVVADDAAHSMFVSNPETVLDALRSL